MEPMQPDLAAKPADDPAMLMQPDYAGLINKHRQEIDRVMMLPPEAQEKEVERYGVNPRALEDHYADMEIEAAELRRQGASANRKTVALAVGAFSAAATATIVKRKAIHESALVQAIVGGLAAFSAGFVATIAGSSLFGGNLKKEGKALAIKARDAFERELAVAIENKQRAAASAVTPQDLPAVEPKPVSATIPRRDASFAAQAEAEKQAAGQQAGRA